jgi:hypothetical protein
MKTDEVPQIAENLMTEDSHIKGRCVSFVKIVYERSCLSTDFSYQPLLVSIDDLYNVNNLGKIIFLRRKGSIKYFSHVAIIYNGDSVIHYTKRMNDGLNYKILISSFKSLLEMYDLVANPY